MDRSNKILDDMLLATKMGEEVLNHYFGRVLKIEKKLKAGLVTQADRESEDVITKKLVQLGYDFKMLGEESYSGSGWDCLESEEPCWILDPLDGTTNFVHGFPVFAISLALYSNKRTQVAVISAPRMDGGEVYTAIRGQGAFFRQSRLSVSQNQVTEDSFLATGFYAEDEAQLKEQLPVFEKLVRQSRAIRRAGAAAYDLALVARGTFDAFWEQGLKPWDTAAGSLLVEEAGGVVETYRGQVFNPKYNSIVSGSSALVKEIQKTISHSIRATTD